MAGQTVALLAQALSPPRWGGSSIWQAVVNETNPADAPSHPQWQFRYFYNADLRADRYEHASGQHSELCLEQPRRLPYAACTVLNAHDGRLYMIYPDATPSDTSCCFCNSTTDSFLIRSDWLQRGSNTSYLGRSSIAGVIVDGWLKWGAFDNHYYATADATQAPVRFKEHKHGQLKQWDFEDWAPVASADLFEPPSGCTTICAATLCHARHRRT